MAKAPSPPSDLPKLAAPAMRALAGAGLTSLAKLAKAREADVSADYVGFGLGDEFVVGYGLDYQGRYRNLPYVGVLKASAAV